MFSSLALDCGMKFPMDPSKRKKQRKKGEERKSSLQKRIVGGKTSRPGEWPWQVLLIRKLGRRRNKIEFCGGAILSEHFILTAAHCFLDSKLPNVSP